MKESNSQQFRDSLAKEIREAPKERRKDILQKAREEPEYWQARGLTIKERQAEEEIDNGFGVLVTHKTLYHGSGTSGIERLDQAEEDTVGSGVYFTSEARDAIGYARRRARRKEGLSPVIYEASVENMKLLDLRKTENVQKVLDGFREVLVEKIQNHDLKFIYQEVLRRAIAAIDSGKIRAGNLREVTFSTGNSFSNYVKSLGYEGLITVEGGEGNDVSNHDTYLIFDPKNAKITHEHKIL